MTEFGGFPRTLSLDDARYFMVLGIDVALRTAGLCAQEMLSVAEHIVPAGRGMPLHGTRSAALLIGLQGSVRVHAGNQVLPLGDSQTLFIPAATRYGYVNVMGCEARLMVISFGAGHDRFLEELSRDPRRWRQAADRDEIELALNPALLAP